MCVLKAPDIIRHCSNPRRAKKQNKTKQGISASSSAAKLVEQQQ